MQAYSSNDQKFSIPYNDLNGEPVILMPVDILSDLPVALSRHDVVNAWFHNDEVRIYLNSRVGKSWRSIITNKTSKKDLRDLVLSNTKALRELIDHYKRSAGGKYDFETDIKGFIAWYEPAKQYSQNHHLALCLAKNPSPKDVHAVVLQIVKQFKQLVENNGLNKVLFVGIKPRHERMSQLLFFTIADIYCKANDLDLSPESNSGRGPVDFKISAGYEARSLVEIKLTSNPQILHGFEKQLEIYKRAENTNQAVYLVLKVAKTHENKVIKLQNMRNSLMKSHGAAPDLVVVDATIKPSASRA